MTTHSEVLGPRAARRRSSLPKRRRWIWVVLSMVGLITSIVLYALSMVGAAVQEMTEPVNIDEVKQEARPVAVQAGQRINILAMGLDDDKLRTDTMLLISIDPERKKIGILHIPRDTRALLAGKGTFEKINGAYAFGVGDKQFPPNLRALKTVEDLLDVSIHYTAVVELDGFRRMIDDMHGVAINIPFVMDYDDPTQNLHIHFKPGLQELDGKRALEFVRWRGNNDGTGYPDGDLGRIRTQQKFLSTVMEQLLKPSNLVSLPNQLLTLSKNIKTTVDSPRILQLTRLAASIGRQDVEFATLPGTDAYLYDSQEDKRLSFYLVNPAETRKLVDRLIRGIDPQATQRTSDIEQF